MAQIKLLVEQLNFHCETTTERAMLAEVEAAKRKLDANNEDEEDDEEWVDRMCDIRASAIGVDDAPSCRPLRHRGRPSRPSRP